MSKPDFNCEHCEEDMDLGTSEEQRYISTYSDHELQHLTFICNDCVSSGKVAKIRAADFLDWHFSDENDQGLEPFFKLSEPIRIRIIDLMWDKLRIAFGECHILPSRLSNAVQYQGDLTANKSVILVK